MDMTTLSIAIPAAGASRRMRGADKLLEQVDGLPLLRRQVMRALATGTHVMVTLPDAGHARNTVLDGLGAQRVSVPDAALGMASSIRAAVAARPSGTRALLVMPADMPDLRTVDLQKVIAAFAKSADPIVLQATSADGVPGHPVVFPEDCFDALAQVKGDEGARAVVQANRHRLHRLALPGQRATTDLDTPEAWARWRAAQDRDAPTADPA